jgi:DNA-binding transcriptional LysR family regulator
MPERTDLQADTYRLDSQIVSDLWIFRAAARFESITQAGKRLGVTQGAVSQRILRLEARLGTPLFRRENGRLALTEAGQGLFEAMDEATAILNGALTRFDRVQRRSLVVSCLPSLATEWLVPHIEGFYAQNPDVELFIRAEVIEPSAERMNQEGIDVLIAYQHEVTADVTELANLQEMIFPVCSRAYRDEMTRAGDVPTITRLHDDVPWIGGPRDFEWRAWTAANPDWKDVAAAERHFNLAHLAYHAALCGQGVAIGRAVLVNRLLERADLIPATDLPAAPGARYRVLAARPGPPGSPVRKFAAWLVAEMAQSQGRTLAMIAER